MSTFQLLSKGNPKTVKGEKQGYMTYILHLSPADVAGVGNMCPKSTVGCRAACLNTAGRGGMFTPEQGTNVIQEARKRKTRQWVNEREWFLAQLKMDIVKAIAQAERKGFIPVFRLNGTSDIAWSVVRDSESKNIFECFPNVQFYDYTAVPNRFRNKPANYHLTFSAKENNETDIKAAIAAGGNIAVVFDLKKSQALPNEYLGLPVINADEHDLRFLDPKGVVCGLYLKGNSKMKKIARDRGFAKKINV